jgi:hypothetical protein
MKAESQKPKALCIPMQSRHNYLMDELEPIFAQLRPLAKEAEDLLLSGLSDAEANPRFEAIAKKAAPWLAQLKSHSFNFFDMPHDCVLPAACDPWLK